VSPEIASGSSTRQTLIAMLVIAFSLLWRLMGTNTGKNDAGSVQAESS
jgi:hypothetical protein